MASEQQAAGAAVPEPVGETMHAHRAAWAEAVVGDGAVDLAAATDPAEALEGATAAVWLDGYAPAARQALVDAAGRGVRLIVGVPAHSAEGEDLARAIEGCSVVPQAPAGGSLIGGASAARVAAIEPAAREHAAWFLICANIDQEALANADARVGVTAGSGLAAHVARLEEALAALSEANVRLAREKLGHHDAAAGALIGRAEARARIAEEKAEEWKGRFEVEQQLAFRHHDWFLSAQAKLNEPHHRAAERLWPAVRRIPGLRPLVRRLRRR